MGVRRTSWDNIVLVSLVHGLMLDKEVTAGQADTKFFVVAYADSRSLSPPAIIEPSTIPGLVAQSGVLMRTHLSTGQSDGGIYCFRDP